MTRNYYLWEHEIFNRLTELEEELAAPRTPEDSVWRPGAIKMRRQLRGQLVQECGNEMLRAYAEFKGFEEQTAETAIRWIEIAEGINQFSHPETYMMETDNG